MSNTFFQPSGGAGQNAQDFVIDAFSDISLPANNNTGFSTSITKNPLSAFFGNDDAPKFEYKTLYIKDLILVADRTKWLLNKPTYEVVFHENFPGIEAYVCGNVRLRNLPNAVSVDLRSEGDIFGVTTTGRRVHFIINPSLAATQTATVKVDGSANGTTISFGDSSQLSTGTNQYYLGAHATTSETRDIHDYQLVTPVAQTLNIAGIGVYFENSTGTVDFYPGSTYLEKTKYTTVSGSGVSLPTLSNYNGAKVLAYKNSSSAYVLSANDRSAPTSTALGASGANLITVATGSGASFPVGSGVGFRNFGGSLFLGFVTNQSTDTLTISPTLPMGISGNIFKAFNAGTTIAISATLHQLVTTVDLGSAFTPLNYFSFQNAQNTLYYQDPLNNYRVFGQSLINSAIDGYRGVYPATTNAFIQVDGNFQAAELEYVPFPGATAVIHATFSINGIAGAFSQQTGVTGLLKQTVFADGMPGWNTFKLSAGGSFMNTVLSKINLYQLASPQSITLGRLAEFDIYGSQINRTAVNQTLMTVGTNQRIYADQFRLTGLWSFGVTASAAGAVFATGSSTNSVFQMNYWGKDFAIIGSQAASFNILVDGQSVGSTLNFLHSVATLGFHTVAVTNSASLLILNAFDFVRPRGELKNLQNFDAVCETASIPQVFAQSDTPQNPKNGDIWGADPKAGSVYVHMWGKWVLLQTVSVTDDPNVGIGIVSHGSTGSDATGAGAAVNLYNQTSWIAGTSDSVNATYLGPCDTQYNGYHVVVDYATAAESNVLSSRQFNRSSWSTFTNRSAARTWGQNTAFRGKRQYYASKGAATGGSVGSNVATVDAWNTASWVAPTAWTDALSSGHCAEINGLLSSAQGRNTAGAATQVHQTRTTSDTVATATNVTNTGAATAIMNDTVDRSAWIAFHADGITSNSVASRWNGSSFAASTTPVASGAIAKCGFTNTSQSRAIVCGGTSTNAVYVYNGTAYATITSMVTNSNQGAGSFV